MPDALLLVAALLSCVCGMTWLALAMKPHWQQALGNAALSATSRRFLRVLGGAGLAASLLLCLSADHPSIAVLVWVMALAASALTVAFTLTWRPRLLAWLVPWARV